MKKQDGAKLTNEVSAFAELSFERAMFGTTQPNQASTPAKKRKKKKVMLAKTVRQGVDEAGNPIEIIDQPFHWKEYTPAESEEDGAKSEDDDEVDEPQTPTEAPEGVRRSNRERSSKLRKANIKNDKLVSSTLENLNVGDVSSDELEDVEDSDEEEEFKVRKLDLQVTETPLDDVAEPEKQAKRAATVKEDHRILLT